MRTTFSPFRPSAVLFVLSSFASVACSSGTSGDAIAEDPWQGDVDLRGCSAPQARFSARCTANDGEAGFALAICGDLSADNTLTIEAHDRVGDFALAVNGASRTASPLHVAGFSSFGGIQSDNTEDITGTLRTNGALTVASPVSVGGDAYVGGILTANNTLSVSGALHASSSPSLERVTAGSVNIQPTTVEAPVNCADRPDIAKLIDDARDQAVVGPRDHREALAAVKKPLTLHLGCGTYRFSSIQADNTLTVAIDGDTTVIVEGSLRVAAPVRFVVADGASFDLLIGGSIEADNTFSVESADRRAWVGVNGGVRVASPMSIDGFLIAPNADVAGDNTLQIRGAAYVAALRVAAPLVVGSGPSLNARGCPL